MNKDYLIKILCQEVEELLLLVSELKYQRENLAAYAIAVTIIAIWGWMK